MPDSTTPEIKLFMRQNWRHWTKFSKCRTCHKQQRCEIWIEISKCASLQTLEDNLRLAMDQTSYPMFKMFIYQGSEENWMTIKKIINCGWLLGLAIY